MKVLSFDVESNGLHGEAFAVAGLVMDSSRQIISQFVSRCPITGTVDAWVQDNVLGPMADMPDTAPDGLAMRAAFWEWFTEAKLGTDLIVASNPYPVEARFLIACQEDDIAGREFDHPFPYFDLSSMLYSLGYQTPAARHDFVALAIGDSKGDAHNPLWDAQATAMGALQAAESVTPSKPSHNKDTP